MELQKSTKKAQEAMVLAAEESAKCKAAKDVIKSLTAQVFSYISCIFTHTRTKNYIRYMFMHKYLCIHAHNNAVFSN